MASSDHGTLLSFENPLYNVNVKEDDTDELSKMSEEFHPSTDDLRERTLVIKRNPFATNRKCLFIMVTSAVAVALLLGLILATTDHFRDNDAKKPPPHKPHSNVHNQPDDVTTVEKIKATNQLQGSIRLVQQKYLKEYEDSGSKQFKKFSIRFSSTVAPPPIISGQLLNYLQMLDVFGDNKINPFFIGTKVSSIRNGSVIVDFMLVFNRLIDTQSEDTHPEETVPKDLSLRYIRSLIQKSFHHSKHNDLCNWGHYTVQQSSFHLYPDKVLERVLSVTKPSTTPMTPPTRISKTQTTAKPPLHTTPLTATSTSTTSKQETCSNGYLCPKGVVKYATRHSHGDCIGLQEVCDGFSDCVGNTDEADCGTNCTNGGFRCRATGAIDRFLRGKCTWPNEQCDGFADCTDLSDEEDCPCKPTEFKCSGGGRDIFHGDRCIPLLHRCDREWDCSDKSDEANCTYSCPSGHFKCANGTVAVPPFHGFCLSLSVQCNTRQECRDGSDEKDCDKECPEHMFTCAKGKVRDHDIRCIPRSFVCDRDNDCVDKSDEKNCTFSCPTGQFACANGTIVKELGHGICLYDQERCNGRKECQDGSDEANCTCSAPSFQCHDSTRCLRADLVCDGRVDCPGADDESGCLCPHGDEHFVSQLNRRCLDFFRCGPKTLQPPFCIHSNERCDGVTQCADGYDELNCKQPCPSGAFRCANATANNTCLQFGRVCDHQANCFSNKTDDVICSSSSCPTNAFACKRGSNVFSNQSRCIPQRLVCDRVAHCHDNSDEKQCDLRCNHGEFMCRSGALKTFPFHGFCVANSSVCDGIEDCSDASDEANCTAYCVGGGSFDCGPLGAANQGGRCIPAAFRCDKEPDCVSGVDESNCKYRCPLGFAECRNSTIAEAPHRGFCIFAPQVCDGHADCLDRSDEAQCHGKCGPEMFTCASDAACVGVAARCDRVTDCADGSDERDCPPFFCQHGYFMCDTGFVNTSHIHTLDGAEVASREFCLPHSRRCDGIEQCLDGSDERKCVKCPPKHFRCKTGSDVSGNACILNSLVCDKTENCQDGSDEDVLVCAKVNPP